MYENLNEHNSLFYLRQVTDYKTNKLICRDCKREGIEHEIVSEPYEVTNKYSDWGPRIPTTKYRCTGCQRENGPWVSASIVGEGW